jgi:hypothetical protein
MADEFLISVSTNAATVAANYRRAPRQIATNVVTIFRRIGAAMQRQIVTEKLNGQLLRARTGNLRRSIYWKIVLDAGAGDDAQIVLTIGADKKKAVYARALEEGATITPKRGQFLTIPVGRALTAAGVARVSAREFISNPGSLGFTSSFVNKAKTAIMGVKKRARGEDLVEPVFALKRSVTLPQRSYLRSTVAERKTWIREQLGAGAMDGFDAALEE